MQPVQPLALPAKATINEVVNTAQSAIHSRNDISQIAVASVSASHSQGFVNGRVTIGSASRAAGCGACRPWRARSEEHTSELQSLMRISYAVFCLKKKNIQHHKHNLTTYQAV